jgi:hypothetical protein
LDRFTSGVLLVAKNDAAHRRLAEQFSGRRVSKTYLALVEGEVKPESGRIARPIARDPVHRTRMTARLAEGRAAWSEYRVLRRFTGFTLLEVRIGTGRTHQIRVHLASIKHPVVGDTLYGAAARPDLGRCFLHAHRIEFQQPTTGEAVVVVSPLAPELEAWLERLSQQSENVLFGQSRNVLLTGSSLKGGRRTATDEPGRARPAGCPQAGEEESDHAEAGCRGDRHHRAAGATTPAKAAAEGGPGSNP